MDDSTADLELPGFRFHPTEEELLGFYLRNTLLGKKLHYDIIGFLNIYHHDPWELPGLAKIGEREWYFFVPRDRKYGSGGRPNRTTKTGFWKATGSDRQILSLSNPKRMIGLKKTLVFYKGRAPRGCKTDWVMNEYRLPDTSTASKDVVLCKIYRKATSLRVLEQRAAMEEETKAFHADTTSSSFPPNPPMDAVSTCSQVDDFAIPNHHAVLKKEAEELLGLETESSENSTENTSSFVELPKGKANLTELQVPKFNMEWTQDPSWTQLRSPWLEILTPGYTNILNF